MKPTDLTPSQITAGLLSMATRFESRAAVLRQAAEAIRSGDSELTPSSGSAGSDSRGGGRSTQDVTPASIRSVIKLRGMRPADLAGHFHTTQEVVRSAIEAPDSGLVIGTRGWVKRKEDVA